MKLIRRRTVDRIIDRVRFSLDTFPTLDYQPLPWLGLEHAHRSAGVISRWTQMQPVIDELRVSTAMDLGCNVGFFPLALGEQGIATLGIESNDKFFRTFQYARDASGIQNVGCLRLKVDQHTIQLLPTVDCVIFLAVWHHIVRYDGLQAAGEMLDELWSRTNRVLFFESGELEMPESFNLPDFCPSPAEWFSEYLSEHCSGGAVTHLGLHSAFAPGTEAVYQRNLFAVQRSK